MNDTLHYELAFHGAFLTFFIYSFLSKKSFLFRDDREIINIEPDSDAIIPKKQTVGSAGYDLYSKEDGSILPNSRKLIDTGIKMEIPVGFYGRIAPRSSLALKYGIDVGGGVIDSDYRGKIKVLLFNHGDKIYKFDKNDRIAQLIFTKIGDFNFDINFLNNTERNEGGFGSTNFIANKYNNGSKKRKIENFYPEEPISKEDFLEYKTSEDETSEEEELCIQEEDCEKETSLQEEDCEKETNVTEEDIEEEDSEEEISEEEISEEEISEEEDSSKEEVSPKKNTETFDNGWWQFSKPN